MFFRRKKSAPKPAEEPSSAAPDAPVGDTPTQFLTGDQTADGQTVQVLLEAIAQVSESKDLDGLLDDIVDRSVELSGAERGLLLLRGEGEDDEDLVVRVARQDRQALEGELRFSTTVAKKVLDEVQPVRATVHSDSEALDLGRSVFDLKLRAVMCVPLTPADRQAEAGPPSGVLYVDSRAATRQFSQRDLSLFAALGQHISIALENARLHLDSLEKVRLEQSLELASAIQRDLMPDIPDDVEGYQLHGWYGPAERTSGDFFDFVRTGDKRTAVVVGDATGHGIGPALITATAQASMRSYMRLLTDAGQVVSMLNQDLGERIDDGRFLTLFLGILAPDGAVDYINAGHAVPFVWRKETQTIEGLKGSGPALGMIADIAYEAPEPVQLAPGDVLAIYSDGLTEARDPNDKDNMFGEEGVMRELSQLASKGLPAKEITLRLVEAALSLAGGLREDDMTLVVVKRL